MMSENIKPNPRLKKDKILKLVSRENGYSLHPNDLTQLELLGRLRILCLRGFVSMRRDGTHLRFTLTKDTHLL